MRQDEYFISKAPTFYERGEFGAANPDSSDDFSNVHLLTQDYIFPLYQATENKYTVVKHWDNYFQEDYYFYAYYKKEVYDYTFYYADTTQNSIANNYQTGVDFQDRDVDYKGHITKVKYDNIVELPKLYNDALPTNYSFYGWYVSTKPFTGQFKIDYSADEKGTLRPSSYYYMDGETKISLQYVSDYSDVTDIATNKYVHNDTTIEKYIFPEGYEFGLFSDGYNSRVVDRDLYIYALYTVVINRYDLELIPSDKAASMSSFDTTYGEVEELDGKYDYLNDTLSGYVDKITYSAYDNDGIDGNELGYTVNGSDGYMTDRVDDVVLIDDSDPDKKTVYNTYNEVLNQIFTRQHETLVLKITCKLGYWLEKYELENSLGESILDRNVNTYRVDSVEEYEIGEDGVVKTNQHSIDRNGEQDDHIDSESKYYYVITFRYCYSNDTTEYSDESTSRSYDISTIRLTFKTVDYTFLNYRDDTTNGAVNHAAAGYTYVPNADNGSTTCNQTFTLTPRAVNTKAFYGNTNIVVFYPKYDEIVHSDASTDYRLVELSSYMSSLKIGNTLYNIQDVYNPYTSRFDLRYMTISAGNADSKVEKIAGIGLTGENSYTSFMVENFDSNPSAMVRFNVKSAFRLGEGAETFILYVCSYLDNDTVGNPTGDVNDNAYNTYSGDTTEQKYCYVLFSDARVENENKDVVASFTDIRHTITTNSSISAGKDGSEDKYVENQIYGLINSTITSVNGTVVTDTTGNIVSNASNKINKFITNSLLPTDSIKYEVYEANGYVLDYLEVTYQGRTYRIDLNDIKNNANDGIITSFTFSEYETYLDEEENVRYRIKDGNYHYSYQ